MIMNKTTSRMVATSINASVCVFCDESLVASGNKLFLMFSMERSRV